MKLLFILLLVIVATTLAAPGLDEDLNFTLEDQDPVPIYRSNEKHPGYPPFYYPNRP